MDHDVIAQIPSIGGLEVEHVAPKWEPPNRDDLIARYRQGTSELRLAQEHGVSRRAVRRILLENGIVPRGGAESQLARFATSTPEYRSRITSAAHEAVRGMKRTDRDLRSRAVTNMQRAHRIGRGEDQFAVWLTDRGMVPVPQLAVGPYNIDLAILPVAVEIQSGTEMPIAHAHRRGKSIQLIEWGISVLWVWIGADRVLSETAADQALTFFELCKGDPSPIGQCRVIRGSGELLSISRDDLYKLASEPAPRHRKGSRYR
jgi:hypothetical protein